MTPPEAAIAFAAAIALVALARALYAAFEPIEGVNEPPRSGRHDR